MEQIVSTNYQASAIMRLVRDFERNIEFSLFKDTQELKNTLEVEIAKELDKSWVDGYSMCEYESKQKHEEIYQDAFSEGFERSKQEAAIDLLREQDPNKIGE